MYMYIVYHSEFIYQYFSGTDPLPYECVPKE